MTSHPPSASNAADWRGPDAGIAEARERGMPILCLAEPDWTNGAQRLALVLGRDAAARDLLANRFVPVRVDPFRRPDLAARLRAASMELAGSAGPPLVGVLTPDGLPLLAYPTIRPEGDGTHPSLASLLAASARTFEENRDAARAEAHALQRRARAPSAPGAPRAWGEVFDLVDDTFGGLDELPKTPRPALLWSLFDATEPEAAAFLERTLDSMLRGGILDQLGGSFHRASRDAHWVVPHFEKTVPGNAALAAVYARGAARFARDDFAEVARGAARFAVAGLDEGVLAVGSDPGYYTWTPHDVQDVLDPALVQALGLHAAITREPIPHVLFRAMEPEAMTERADDPPEVLARRLAAAKEHLRFARFARPSPEAVRSTAPAWIAETLRWTLRARAYGLAVDEEALVAHLDALVDRPFDSGRGYGRDDGDGGERHWLQDQVAVAAACLEAADVVDHPRARRAAERLGEVMLHAYDGPGAGAPWDEPERPGAGPSHDVVDHELPAAVPTAIAVLLRLAGAGGDRAAAFAATARRWSEGNANTARGSGAPVPDAAI